MINVPLLKKICETPGVPGYEKQIRDLVIKELKGLVDELEVDAMGNVIAIKKGKKDKRIMIGAHMDEIGFIVNHIDDEGFVRFHTLGGFDPKTLTSQRVVIHGKKDIIGVMGSKPIHIMSPEERSKPPRIQDYFIDIGLDKKAAEKVVEIGNTVTRERELVEMGTCVNCKSIDNRVSVFVLIEMLRSIKKKKPEYDIYAVFTVQEEVGLRGANVAAQQINPHFGFGLDTTIAFDVPGSQPHEMVTKLGDGAGIKLMDSSVICDYRMVDYLKKTATKNKIPFQMEILPAGGTDTAGIQTRGRDGSIAGAISIPTRHIHSVIETADKKDIKACIELLEAACLNLHTYNWAH